MNSQPRHSERIRIHFNSFHNFFHLHLINLKTLAMCSSQFYFPEHIHFTITRAQSHLYGYAYPPAFKAALFDPNESRGIVRQHRTYRTTPGSFYVAAEFWLEVPSLGKIVDGRCPFFDSSPLSLKAMSYVSRRKIFSSN